MSSAVTRDAVHLRSLVHRIPPGDPGAFNNLGVLFHSKGLHADAVDAFLRALELDPLMRTAARNLEIAATAPGACDARLGALAARLASDPDDRDARLAEARLLRLIGRLDDAARKLDALIAEHPDDSSALLERGLLERRSGDLRRAQRWLERATNADGTNVTARLTLAEVLYNRGANEQALQLLDVLVQDAPQLADAHLLRGFVLGDLGYHEEAADAAQRASSLNPALAALQGNLTLASDNAAAIVHVAPDGELAHYGLGLAFRQRGYFAGARRELQRALDAGEEARLVLHALAELDLVSGAAADALARYESLLAAHEDDARLWCEHGVALHQLGRVNEAADSYRRALRVDPRRAMSYNNLGVALAHLGDDAAAREALARAVELEPGFIRARLNLARWNVQHGDVLGALTLLRESTAFQPNDADAWCEFGRVLLHQERPAEARQVLSRAIELDEDHAAARYALAAAMTALGDHDGASRETEQALKRSPFQPESRLQVGIDLQIECPEATAAIDLLMLQEQQPLRGVVVSEHAIEEFLPEAPEQGIAQQPAGEERILRMCEEADDFASRGLHGEAQERYERASTWLSSDTTIDNAAELKRRALLGDARSRCLLGRGAELLRAIRMLDEESADDAEVIAIRGVCEAQAALAAEGSSDIAQSTIFRLLRIGPQSAALLHFVGDAAHSLDEHELAVVCYRRALSVDPGRPTPRVKIARVLRQQGNLAAAQLELVAALTACATMRDARFELAQVYRKQQRVRDALAHLTAILDDDPTDIEALIALGESLCDAGRLPDARIALAHARRHAPDHPHALYVEGTVLAAQGRHREARERWQQIVQLQAASSWAERAQNALTHDLATWHHTPTSQPALPRANTA